MFKNKLNYKLLNILIFAIIVYLALITMNYWLGFISKIFSLVRPFIIAFALAYAIHPLVRILKSKGIRNKLAVTIVIVGIIFLFGGLIIITVPLVYEQLITLSSMIGELINDISTRFDINLGDFKTSIDTILNNLIVSLGKYVSDGTASFVGKSVKFVTNAIIVGIVSIYFLADMDRIRATFKKFLKKRKDRSYKYVKEIDGQLGQYFKGLLMFILIQLVEYSLLFRLVGHPNWLLLGILASITTVIPYFGGLITNIIACVLATVVSPTLFVATLAITLIFPNIDGYIISPRVYGKTNNINPLWTIFAAFAGGALFGIAGIVIALPLYIILNSTYKFFKGDISDKIDDIKDGRNAK